MPVCIWSQALWMYFFPFRFWEWDLGFDCIISWVLPFFLLSTAERLDFWAQQVKLPAITNLILSRSVYILTDRKWTYTFAHKQHYRYIALDTAKTSFLCELFTSKMQLELSYMTLFMIFKRTKLWSSQMYHSTERLMCFIYSVWQAYVLIHFRIAFLKSFQIAVWVRKLCVCVLWANTHALRIIWLRFYCAYDQDPFVKCVACLRSR